MLSLFIKHISDKKLFQSKSRLLLAFSGGVDSVVLAHLLKQSKFDVSLAHCNFKLRGKESEADEKFCREYAKKNNLSLYVKQFDVKAYCKKNKVSTQMAARDLRYNWFNEVCKKEEIDYLLTAHHANDVVETIFINLLRGTGINGLKGITEKKGNLVRPLLPFSKNQIEAYAKKEKIKFRLDKSNLKEDYTRNFLRLKVIPQLKKVNNNIESTFIKNIAHFSQEAQIVEDFLKAKSNELLKINSYSICINKDKLKQQNYLKSILHFVLSPYGFNDTQQQNILYNLENNLESGKLFASTSHKLVIERNELVITKLSEHFLEEIVIDSFEGLKEQEFLKVSKEKKFVLPKKNELFVAKNQLQFPLVIRAKRTGDKFKPFGMNGFRLLSDFLKDEKLSVSEKEKVKLLVNGNGQIIWVMGYRSDERYKINVLLKDLIKIKFIG